MTGVCVGDFFFGEEKPSAEDGEPSPLAADIFAERSSILDGECSRTSFVLARTEGRSATPPAKMGAAQDPAVPAHRGCQVLEPRSGPTNRGLLGVSCDPYGLSMSQTNG